MRYQTLLKDRKYRSYKFNFQFESQLLKFRFVLSVAHIYIIILASMKDREHRNCIFNFHC